MKLLKKIKSDVSVTIEQDGPVVDTEPSFHNNIKSAVVLAQFFGLMPLHNVMTTNGQNVKFKWRSIRLLYAIFNVFGAFVTSLVCIVKFAVFGLEIDKSAATLFYIGNFFANIQFVQIARFWPKILNEWSYVEKSMRNYEFSPNLNKKFIFLTVVILGLAAVEHCFFIWNAIYDSEQSSEYKIDPVKTYFKNAFPHYFELFTFSVWLAIFMRFLTYCAHFHGILQTVKRLERTKVFHDKFWKEIREDYNKLSHLVKIVDEHLGPLVLISYFNDIFFLCIQLYNSLNERVGVVETVYFFYSFGFLVARAIAVSMYGAWLYEETRKPLAILHRVPSEHYCQEVGRFIEQINSCPLGITGANFFIVTRSFLLQMAGTVITIELVIFQFGRKFE